MGGGVHPARPVGFEPTTLGSEDRCAIQLRHGRPTVEKFRVPPLNDQHPVSALAQETVDRPVFPRLKILFAGLFAIEMTNFPP